MAEMFSDERFESAQGSHEDRTLRGARGRDSILRGAMVSDSRVNTPSTSNNQEADTIQKAPNRNLSDQAGVETANPAHRSKIATATRRTKAQSRDSTWVTSPPSSLHQMSSRQFTPSSTRSASRLPTSATSERLMSQRQPSLVITTTALSIYHGQRILMLSLRHSMASQLHGLKMEAALYELTRHENKLTGGLEEKEEVVDFRAGGPRGRETGGHQLRDRIMLSN